jgi:hypothetical protein
MIALSVMQPWASLLLAGVKRFDTRPWHTAHRGLLAIHASRKLTRDGRALCAREPVRWLLRHTGHDDIRTLPCGGVLGTVNLLRCVRVEDLDLDALSETERSLGDFSPGRWAWEMADPARWPMPVTVRGRLGLFELPPSLRPAM